MELESKRATITEWSLFTKWKRVLLSHFAFDYIAII
jgi:hypothetical protein